MVKFWQFFKKLVKSGARKLMAPIIPGNIQEHRDFMKNVVWLIFAISIFIAGMIISIFSPIVLVGFWMSWGIICGIPMIVTIFKSMGKMIKKGYRIGKKRKHEYVSVENLGGIGVNPSSNTYEIKRTTADESIGWSYAAFCVSMMAWAIILGYAGQIILAIKIVWTSILVLGYLKEKGINNQQ